MSATTFNVTAPPATNRLSLAPPATNRLHLAPLSHLSRHLLPPLRSLPPLTFDTLLLFFPSFERLYLLILLHSQLFTSLIVRSVMFCFDKTNKVKRTERRAHCWPPPWASETLPGQGRSAAVTVRPTVKFIIIFPFIFWEPGFPTGFMGSRILSWTGRFPWVKSGWICK